jgi:hypothetical protein
MLRRSLLVGLCLGLGPGPGADLRAGAPGAALAYVRLRAEDGTPVRWAQGCVLLAPDPRAPQGQQGDAAGAEDLALALRAAIEGWRGASAPCSALSILPQAAAARPARLDGVNVVTFATTTWGRDGLPYDPSAVAITTVSYRSEPGQQEHGAITDTDIELNAVGFRFARLGEERGEASSSAGKPVQDLQNTLTHELGHALGLGHNCREQAAARPPIDQDGVPVPECDAAGEAVRRATMFPYAAERETQKRSVGPDEALGVCQSYPLGAALLPCEQSVRAGCRIGPGHGGMRAGGLGWSVLCLGALGWPFWINRSRRRTPRRNRWAPAAAGRPRCAGPT